MTLAISYPVVGSGGSGGTSVTLTLSTSDPTPTSILVTRSAPTSCTLQTWTLEYKKYSDVGWTLFADNLTALTQTVPALDPYDPETDPDPLVTPLYSFRATALVTVETPVATATGSTTEQTAPTTPVARQSWNAGWRLTNYQPLGFIPEGQRRVGRTRLRNLTGGPAQALAFDVVQGTNAAATYDIAFGPWSSSLD